MTAKERKGYVRHMAGRYRKAAGRGGKSALIAEVVANTGYHRKSVIRLMQDPPGKRTPVRKRKRAALYTGAVEAAFVEVWKAADFACGQLTREALPDLVAILKRRGYLKMERCTEELLGRMSRSTMDRLMRRHRHLRPAGRYTPRRPGRSAMARAIPVEVLPEPAHTVGTIDSDTVQHDGGDTRGVFVSTANFIDRSTFWSCKRVVYGKRQDEMKAAVREARAAMPMAWWKLHFDGGGEYINGKILPYCRAHGIHYTTGRPYRSNDNARVENRNRFQVRRRVGRIRIDDRRRAAVLQRIWELDDLYHNFFHPVKKLVKATVSVVDGVRHRQKWYDRPRTPYHRITEDATVDCHIKKALGALRGTLDPVALLAQMQRLIRTL